MKWWTKDEKQDESDVKAINIKFKWDLFGSFFDAYFIVQVLECLRAHGSAYTHTHTHTEMNVTCIWKVLCVRVYVSVVSANVDAI